DTFIHENFFSEPYHFAYVYDPLAGSEGFFFRSGKAYRQAERYWIGGKPRKVFTRAEPADDPEPKPSAELGPAVAALNRLAAALHQSNASRNGDGVPLPWLIVALLGAVLVFYYFTVGHGSSAGAPRAMVVISHDPGSGRDLGIEIVPVA